MPSKRIKRDIDIGIIGDECWREIFRILCKFQYQLSLSSTCKRLRRILFGMDHMLGWKFLIEVKKKSITLDSVKKKVKFLQIVMDPLENELKHLQEQKIIEENNITIEGLCDINFEENCLYDADTLVW